MTKKTRQNIHYIQRAIYDFTSYPVIPMFMKWTFPAYGLEKFITWNRDIDTTKSKIVNFIKKEKNTQKKIEKKIPGMHRVMLFLLAATFVVCWYPLQSVWSQIRTDGSWSRSKMFDSLKVLILEIFFLKKLTLKKKSADGNKPKKIAQHAKRYKLVLKKVGKLHK